MPLIVLRPILALVFIFSTLSCATSVEVEAAKVRTAADLYPLGVGHTWVFEVERFAPDRSHKGTREVTILEAKDGRYLTSEGSVLSLVGDQLKDGRRVLLKGPIVVGTKWIVVPKPGAVERYEIIATDAKRDVTAGFFKRCVRVRIEEDVRGPNGERGVLRGVWTYAEDTGPVHFYQSLVTDEGERDLVEVSLARFKRGSGA